jgi:hypothetical protein
MQFRSLQNVCVSGWAPIFLEAESVVSQESSRPSSRMATKSEGDDCLGGSTTTVFADHFPRETFWVFHIYVSLPCGKHINIVETTKQKFYTKFEFMNPASVKKQKTHTSQFWEGCVRNAAFNQGDKRSPSNINQGVRNIMLCFN